MELDKGTILSYIVKLYKKSTTNLGLIQLKCSNETVNK